MSGKDNEVKPITTENGSPGLETVDVSSGLGSVGDGVAGGLADSPAVLSPQIEAQSEHGRERDSSAQNLGETPPVLIEDIISNELQNLAGIEKIISKERLKDIRRIPLMTLHYLEESYPGILLYMFADFEGEGNTKSSFSDFKNKYDGLKTGDSFSINFRGNKEAFWKIGLNDILNPKYRKVSVVEKGNKRTSNSRIGYKGGDDVTLGFFDDSGYIPVFTNSTVIIENNDANDPVDNYSDAERYRKTQKTGPSAPVAPVRSRPTPGYSISEENSPFFDKSLSELQEIQDPNQRVAGIARYLVSINDRDATSCGNWVDKVYDLAYQKYPNRKQKSTAWRNDEFIKTMNRPPKNPLLENVPDKRGKLLNPRSLTPGSHVWYFNDNKSDVLGMHSAIFLGWEDERKLIANCVSFPGTGKPARQHKVDFKKRPITRISNPV